MLITKKVFSFYIFVTSFMRKPIAKKVFSVIFFTIFFIKVVISIAPLVITHFDKHTIHAVIMQLEIEHSAKSNDVKETSAKYYHNVYNVSLALSHSIQLLMDTKNGLEHNKHVSAFYPSVPTPPPNI